jgi:hypothetical protein
MAQIWTESLSVLNTFNSSGVVTGFELTDGTDWGRASSGVTCIGEAYSNVAIGPNYAVGA